MKSDNFESGRSRIFGRNGTVGTTWESLYELSQDVDLGTILSTGSTLEVSSSSANDDDGGSGTNKIGVYGLGTDYKPLYEEITMNGQTAVVGTKIFLKYFGHMSLDKINAGDIYVIKSGTGGTYSGGVPGTLTSGVGKMLAGEGVAMSGFYTVPLGRTVRIEALVVGNYTQACVIGIFTRDNANSECRKLDLPINLGNQGSGMIDLTQYKLEFPEKTDIILRVKGASASAVTSAVMLIKEI